MVAALGLATDTPLLPLGCLSSCRARRSAIHCTAHSPHPPLASAAFFEMEGTQQQRHAQRLVKLLQQGKHGMVAAHIRACLQRQGVLPAAPVAGRGQAAAAAEPSAAGSGVG